MKINTSRLKYFVLNKHTKELKIHGFKTKVAQELGISVRTLDRNMPYENKDYIVGKITSTSF